MENLVAERFGRNLREVREAQEPVKKMGQKELADLVGKLMGTPMHLNTISRMEKGTRIPSVTELLALAIALGVTPNRLLLTGAVDPGRRVALTPTSAVIVPEPDAWSWATGAAPLPDVYLPDVVERRPDSWEFGEQNRPHQPPNRTMTDEVNRHLVALNKIDKKVENVRSGADHEEPREAPVPRSVIAAHLTQRALVLELDDRAEQQSGPIGEG